MNHRLIRLYMGQDEDPEYEAVSYCWGSKNDPSHVCVNTDDGDERISITHNLDEALRCFRYERKPRLLWADALCINQVSIGEKNHQVAMMGNIYSRAKRVLIWIGPERDESDKALGIMQQLCDHVNYNWQSITLLSKSQNRGNTWAMAGVPLPYQNGELNAVLSLFERPYFNRTWIRQETVFAKDTILHCGRRTMIWDNLRTAIACFYTKAFHYSAVSTDKVTDFNDIRLKMYQLCYLGSYGITYSRLRLYFGSTDCWDPRDKVYAALSMLGSQDRSLGITPDYARGVEELYTDVARRVILCSQRLDLFSTCVLSSTGMQLPSWVPDWSSAMPISEAMSNNWSACGWISAQVSVRDNMSICVAGVEVGQITSFQHVSSSFNNKPSRIFAILRKFKPAVEQTATTSSTGRQSRVPAILRKFGPAAKHIATKSSTERQLAQNLVVGLLRGYFAESYWPRQTDRITISQYVKALKFIWASSLEYDELDSKMKLDLVPVLTVFHGAWQGLCLLHTANGYVGHAYSNIRKGDIVCMLLGSRFPVVLRQTPHIQLKTAWRIVSICCVPGLMNGELIYGTKLPSTWETVTDHVSGVEHRIDGWPRAFHDTETHELRTDPAEILNEMGIKVDSYQREPHRLEVLPETLRGAGIPLQDFVLV
jgi:hypothetical protein